MKSRFSLPHCRTIYCLNVGNGQGKWSFFTEGPVRLAPAIFDDKVYVGPDDGVVYCLKSENGDLVWNEA